jgi:hypothetical protein
MRVLCTALGITALSCISVAYIYVHVTPTGSILYFTDAKCDCESCELI